MAPEAYTLKVAVDGWIAADVYEHTRQLAAAAYNQYQKCGLNAARRLLVTGWMVNQSLQFALMLSSLLA